MFEKFPKIRQPLPKAFQDLHTAHYISNREGQTAATSISKRMERWLHKQVAKDVASPQDLKKATLELGAGTLNQLQYEPSAEPYDIVEPFEVLYKNSPLLNRVRTVYSDILEIPADSRYDRITSVATLEHVCNLPEVVAKSGLLLTGNGVFRAAIPNEGTILWTLGWKCTTGVEFRLRNKLDYSVMMKHEHVNTAKEIGDVLEYFFEDVKCKVFGLTKSFAFYRYYECRMPNLKRCEAYHV